VEDGAAVALPRGPEHGPKAATGRDGRFTSIHFLFAQFSCSVCAAPARDMKKAGPEGAGRN
jgi:hypothetical protein